MKGIYGTATGIMDISSLVAIDPGFSDSGFGLSTGACTGRMKRGGHVKMSLGISEGSGFPPWPRQGSGRRSGESRFNSRKVAGFAASD